MNIADIIALERHRGSCSWIATYGFVQKLASSIEAVRLCEIGVAYGYHAEHLLEQMPGIHYQGVDPYLANYDPNDPFVRDVAALYEDDAQRAMDRLFQAVSCTLMRHGGRANLLRKSSVEGAAMHSDAYFDLIYIDGDHRYDSVKSDLNAWYGKVKKGGILCGDDFDWPGVRAAVLEFMAGRGKTVTAYQMAGSTVPGKWSVEV